MLARRLIGVAFVSVVGLVGVGCTQLEAYRTHALTGSGEPEIVSCVSGAAREDAASCQSPEAGRYAIQRRQYRYALDPGHPTPRLQAADYYLSVVEFDDQGWFVDEGQVEALMQLLASLETRDRAEGKNGHALILVFAHGWKHNADRCDNNVLCFARVVERIDILERQAHVITGQSTVPRRVVGVYLGWRGLSLEGPLKDVTFWSRKATAQRVGQGGVMELLTRLNEYRSVRNPSRQEDKTQLAIIGHSFGGLVIQSALTHVLMERAADTGRYEGPSCQGQRGKALPSGGITCYETAKSFGDFVVLVNPAFEGSAYEPLFNIAANRCYRPTQRPVLMTVTSTGDSATGTAFPLGRFVGTLFERHQASSPQQGTAIVSAIGHDQRYETHKLRWRPGEGGRPTSGEQTGPGQEIRAPGEDPACGCPHLDPPETFNWMGFAEALRAATARATPIAAPDAAEAPEKRAPETGPGPGPGLPVSAIPARPDPRGEGRLYTGYGPNVVLVGDPKYSANYPYLVVKADKEIIADHNAIYSEPFVRFLHAFFLLHIAARHPFEADVCHTRIEGCRPGGPKPCERSCQLADGRPCTAVDRK